MNIGLEVLSLFRAARDWSDAVASELKVDAFDLFGRKEYGQDALRQRDAFPKYLTSLSTDKRAAYFDPKSGALRGNPLEDAKLGARVYDVGFRGENEKLRGGDVSAILRQEAEIHAISQRQRVAAAAAAEHGHDGGLAIGVHAVALPTAAEDLVRAKDQIAPKRHLEQQRAVAEIYGATPAVASGGRHRRMRGRKVLPPPPPHQQQPPPAGDDPATGGGGRSSGF